MESYRSDQSLFPNTMSINPDDNCMSLKFERQLKLNSVMSDVQFPANNGIQGGRQDQDVSISGGSRLQLPKDLEDMINSLLPNNYDFPVGDYDPGSNLMDLEIGAASLWQDVDEETLNVDNSFTGSNNGGLQPMASGPRLPGTTRRRPKTTRSQRSSIASLQPPIAHHPTSDTQLHSFPPIDLGVANDAYSNSYPPLEKLGVTSNSHSQQYPHLEELGVASDSHSQCYPPLEGLSPPAEELGGTSDAGSSTSSDTATRPRRRRPRVSYRTLTEEEKYQRIRDLNNEASRHYRERHRNQLSQMEEEERVLRERNAELQARVANLEQLRDKMKQFSHNFLRQHMGRT
ncbi:uncharacterized protein [Panulirus ornatus]|uniref:uncharacterized protein n=1 Tax=Panulirus ornatus TaxID=150431 RepID=UPI003A8AD1D0